MAVQDWQLDKSVLDSNKYMLDNQLYCDITFIFDGQNKKESKKENSISAHKYMLISRSPVFCAMFTGPAKDENSEIRIEDVDKDSFHEMLRYIYFEKANLSGYNVLSVLYCAKKYMISSLEKACRDYLEKKVDHTNVCFILEQASIMDEKSLEEKCLNLLDGAAENALKSHAFTQIKLSTVERILNRETLSVREIDVYNACIIWAEAECSRQKIEKIDDNKRKVLGDVMYLIRFPTMDLDEFVKDVANSSVLTPEEALDIVLYVKKSKPRNKLPFPDKPRAGTWQEQLFDCSYQREQGGNYGINTTFRLQGNVEILSVYLLMAGDRGRSNRDDFEEYPVRGNYRNINMNLQSIKARINLLRNRFHCDRQLYEAVFVTPVKLQSGRYAVSVDWGGNYSNVVQVTGQNTLQFKGATIAMNSNPWHMIVGFKLKSVVVKDRCGIDYHVEKIVREPLECFEDENQWQRGLFN